MKEHFTEQKSPKDKGFSLVEIVVIVAIMIVLLAILTPSILRYVENSRMQKDDSAMDEVCHGVLLALSDSEIFDEAVSYAIPNNYVTYTDSSGVYAAKYVDEEFWAPDGSGNAVTITFNPDENGTYTLADGLVNDMTYGNGSVADTRVADGLKQCYFSEMGQQKLYHKVEQTIGSTFSEKSATYKNSSYTVFITFDVVNGIKRADVYGEWNGTNLDESCPASLGSGTSSYEEEEPIQTKPGGTIQSNYTSSDLQGGGGTSGNTPSYKQDDLPCGHKPTAPGNHDKLPCDHYACRCDCEPAPCGIEGHLTGDGLDHTKGACGHYNCECSGCIIPEGGVYYVGVTSKSTGTYRHDTYTAKYEAGERFPESVNDGDVYHYGDYEYRWNQYYDNYSTMYWYKAPTQGGWGVDTRQDSKASYGEILSHINNQPVNTLSYTFGRCRNMTTAPKIPETITSMNGTFHRCASLTLPPVIPDSVTNLTNTFWECTSLRKAPTLPQNAIKIYGVFRSCSSLVTYDGAALTQRDGDFSQYQLPSHITSVGSVFEGCSKLTHSPKIPDTVTDMYMTFWNCSSLKNEGVPILPPNLTKLSSTFTNCTSLTDVSSLNIPNGVTSLESTFRGCTGLVNEGMPIIPSTVTEMSQTFSGCTSLTDLSNFVLPQNVYRLSGTFSSCSNLVVAPKIPNTAKTISSLFANCTSLKDVSDVIVLNYNQSMDYTFKNCTSLTGIVKAKMYDNHGNIITGCFEGTVLPITLVKDGYASTNRMNVLAATGNNGNVTVQQ